MRKFHPVYNDDAKPSRKRSIVPIVVVTILLMLLSPLVYEGGLICLSKWQTILGTYTVPNTPILNSLAEWWRTTDQEFRPRASQTLIRGNWNPGMAVPIAIFWATAAGFILRRTR
jgi:SNF family Na+-dependent transporter